MNPKTLVFCTSYAESVLAWDERWGRWIRAITHSGLDYDTVLIVDDGSPELPPWEDITVVRAEDPVGEGNLRLHYFDDRLGRAAETNMPFPGWYRSFAHAVQWGIQSGYDRIIHIESDAFLISDRAIKFFNSYQSGWAGLWCQTHRFPESALQIINRDQFAACRSFFARPYEEQAGNWEVAIENQLPFTLVNRELIGDRYGEAPRPIPEDADYAAQVLWLQSPEYYWWLAADGSRRKPAPKRPRDP